MINFNNLKFAKNNNEILNSLFSPDGTCAGTYKRNHKGTHLYNLQGELFAYMVHNDRQGYFVVSAVNAAGVNRYMFSTCTIDEKYLHIENMSSFEIENMVKQSLHY